MQIPISRIKVLFYIRVALERERIDFFHDLMLNSVQFDPVDVMPGEFPDEYILLDGRHRIIACLDLGEEEIEATIHKKMNLEEAFSFALERNYGGSLPPTEEDFIHLADIMIKNKMSRERVVKSMGVLPAKIAGKYYDKAKERFVHILVCKVIDLVSTTNTNREEAIKKVCEDQPIKITVKHIEAEHIKRTRNQITYKPRYERMMSDMGKRFRTFNKLNGKMFKTLFEGYSRNEVEPKTVREILQHFAKLVGNTIRMITDQEKRFDMKSVERKESVPLFGTRITTRRERRQNQPKQTCKHGHSKKDHPNCFK